jgi:hypothetical protein
MPDGIRDQIRAADQELEDLRREMDAEADRNGGHIPHDLAVKFAERLEEVTSRGWALRAKLRTPAPSS